jgi:hypothetical protein
MQGDCGGIKVVSDMIMVVVVSLIIGFLVLTQILPFIGTTMDIAAEPLPGIDVKVKYDALIGSAFTLNSYTFATSMPRDAMGRLAWEAVNYLEKSRAEAIFGSQVGQLFVQSIVESRYLQKHRFECVEGCESLNTCQSVGESIYGTVASELTEDEIRTMLIGVTGDCLRVADYLVRRNQHLAKQAEITSGTLTDSWTEAPP